MLFLFLYLFLHPLQNEALFDLHSDILCFRAFCLCLLSFCSPYCLQLQDKNGVLHSVIQEGKKQLVTLAPDLDNAERAYQVLCVKFIFCVFERH